MTFETRSNLMALRKTAEISRTSLHRLKYMQKPALVIVDEVGFMPLSPAEANLRVLHGRKDFVDFYFQQGI
ncbi:hypothetical protein [uncultured Oscillibacter sp.]|uniref:hypothetical protein n=1 Tax=uncultured Oscillibacter sp. TaxID=876091 RepID=UPI0025F1CCE0|nr:hypothetical protein [uncultured Oscillibacter sp.]